MRAANVTKKFAATAHKIHMIDEQADLHSFSKRKVVAFAWCLTCIAATLDEHLCDDGRA